MFQIKRRARRLLAVAGAAGAFSLSIGIVGAATPANAFVGPAVPIVIGETLAAPAADTLAAGACAGLLPLCIGVGAAIAGGALYATRDSWLPVVKGVFADAFSTSSTPGAGCSLTASAAPDSATGQQIVIHSTFTGCALFGGQPVYVASASWSCQDTATGVVVSQSVGTPNTGNIGSFTATGSGSANYIPPNTGCGGSQKLVALDVSGNSAYPFKGHATWGSKVPDDKLSQTTTVTCALADATTQKITKTVTGQADGIIIPSCQAAYPGSVPVHVGVTGGWPGAERNGWSQDLTNPKTQYPDCFAADGTYLNTCRVRVWINGQPCVNGMAGCYDPDQYLQDHPEATKACKWGPYTIPWKDCAPLKHHYGSDTATQTQTVTNTDPATGAPDPDPTSDTNTGKTTNQGLPTEGSNPTAPRTTPDGNTDPDSQSCWGTGWSWNPVDWVVIPVKCSLLWAFKPPDGWEWDSFVDQVKARPPASLVFNMIDVVTAFGDGFSNAGDCGVLADFGGDMQITCAQIKSIPGFGGLYALGQVALFSLTGLGVLKMIQASVGGRE
jgi:hypothetical protein